MRTSPAVLTLTALLALSLSLTACAPPAPEIPEVIEIELFYDGSCASCDKLGEFHKLLAEELQGAEEYPYTLTEYNEFSTGGMQRKKELLAALGIGDDAVQFFTPPTVVINGDVFTGEDMVRENLREAYLTAGEDYFVYGRPPFDPSKQVSLAQLMKEYEPDPAHSNAFYFYRSTCEECALVSREILPGIPESELINGEETAQDITKINIFSGRNAEILMAFFDHYGVPDEEREVPIVFTAEQYFSGYDSISGGLAGALKNGGGLGLKLPG